MAVLPAVSYDDVNGRYLDGDLDNEFDRAKVETQIADAVDFASSRWGSMIASRISDQSITPNLFKRVIADAVLRVLRNPGGYSSENEGGVGYSRRADVASGALGFTADDVETLSGISVKQIPGTIGVGLDWGWS